VPNGQDKNRSRGIVDFINHPVNVGPVAVQQVPERSPYFPRLGSARAAARKAL